MEIRQIEKVSFIGMGIIGSGLATNCLAAGVPVIMQSMIEDEQQVCKDRIYHNLGLLIENGLMSEEQRKSAMSRLTLTTSYEEACKDVYFIHECVPEKYEIKQSVINEIEKYALDTAIIASTTSGLSIEKIASFGKKPERIIGAHPYNPANLIPLMELGKTSMTEDGVIETAYRFYQKIKKEPVILQKESIGFIANRIQMAVYRECVDMVMKGICSVEDVDKACTFGPGIRWGIIGQLMILHLSAGPGGIKAATEKYSGSTGTRLAALADWKTMPEGWGDIAMKGIKEEMNHRSPETGKDMDSVIKYRDEMLIELLKLHHKL